MRRTLSFPIIFLASTLAALACSGSGASPVPGACSAGTVLPCECATGGLGVQACAASGIFAACVCGTNDAGSHDAGGVQPSDASCACDSPPAPACVGGNTLLVSSLPGTCARGACAYTQAQVPCSEGCVNGACVGTDPCASVTCGSPPSASCSGNELETFAATGTCSNGVCGYASSTTTCASGCAGGACVGGSCDGVVCDSPPASKCTSATNLETYEFTGTCSNGACGYAGTVTTCTTGAAHATAACEAGSCTFTCSAGYSLSGGQCVSQGTPTPPSTVAGTWTLQSHTCGGTNLILEGWASTFSFQSGAATWDSQFMDGCTIDTTYSGVTYGTGTITYTAGSTQCGSSCSQENGDVCTTGSFPGGSMSYTVSSGTMTLTETDALCSSGPESLIMMMQ